MALLAALLAFLLVLPFTLAQLPDAVPISTIGKVCRLGGFAPLPCPSSQTCVLTDFGNPFVDGPRIGKCRRVRTPPPCTVAHCATVGAKGLCSVTTPTRLVATCAAWATRSDIGGDGGPDCDFACTEECRTPRLVASDGSEYCNICKLQVASCRADFAFFGPVDKPDPCRQRPIPIFQAAECCFERGIGCLRKGRRCSTAGSRIRPVPCKTGLTCVITDFGFPATDIPNSGRCRSVSRVPRCTVGRCSRRGRRLVCRVPLPRGSGIISTCGAWATRSDGNPGPDCGFLCPAVCAVGNARPLASNGKRFCSLCALRQKSCATGFRIFGPVSG